MSYIGKTPTIGNFQVCDSISVVNGQAAYTMQVNSVNVVPESANHMLVSLNGILQKPGSSFTVSGSTITFASNLSTGDVIDFITILGNVLDLGVPSDDTVTAAKLNNDIISGQTALASEPADTDEFLVSDAGTLKRIDYSLIKGGGITVAQQFRLTTNFSTTSTVPISSNWEQVDTDGYGGIGTAMSESSGVFTFPTTGIYLISISVDAYRGGDTRYWKVRLDTTIDNGTYGIAADSHGGIKQASSDTHDSVYTEFIFDVTDVSTHKVRFGIEADQSTTILGSTSKNQTCATFIRLGDT